MIPKTFFKTIDAIRDLRYRVLLFAGEVFTELEALENDLLDAAKEPPISEGKQDVLPSVKNDTAKIDKNS
jgi:hypothetical protein